MVVGKVGFLVHWACVWSSEEQIWLQEGSLNFSIHMHRGGQRPTDSEQAKMQRLAWLVCSRPGTVEPKKTCCRLQASCHPPGSEASMPQVMRSSDTSGVYKAWGNTREWKTGKGHAPPKEEKHTSAPCSNCPAGMSAQGCPVFSVEGKARKKNL